MRVREWLRAVVRRVRRRRGSGISMDYPDYGLNRIWADACYPRFVPLGNVVRKQSNGG